MKNAVLHVPNPCSQEWNKMTPQEKGRFCGSCNKTVVDFTKMKNEEILSYLKNQPGKTCGYFLPHQVEVKRPKHHQFLLNWYENTQNGIKTRFLRNVSLAFIALCMTLVGCNSPSTTGEIEPPSDSSERITGDVAMPSDSLENEVPLTYDSLGTANENNIIGETMAVYENKSTKVEKVETNILGDIALHPIEHDSVKSVSPGSSETKKEG